MDETGAIEGDVTLEFTGHVAAAYKEGLDEESPAEREKEIIAMLKGRISTETEVTNIVIENLEDPEMPLVYKMKIRVPGYAESTGKRFFVKPNVFSKNAKSLFETSNRRNDIFFRYPWTEKDDVSIEIPAGYRVEAFDPPQAVADSRNTGSYVADIKYDESTRVLRYRKEFAFGRNNELEFSSASYGRIKDLFDSYFRADQHAITLIKEQ